MKKNIAKSYLPVLCDCVDDLMDNIQRDIGILAYQFHVFMALDAICQLLWVINDVYDPSSKRTEAYLFKLSAFQDKLLKLIKEKKLNIQPEERRKEIK